MKFLEFLKRAKINLIVLLSLLVTTFLLIGLAHGVEQDWGNISVENGTILAKTVDDEEYQMGYKLYIPKGVDEEHPAPAILCLHGYQNDHETSAGYAIEFARHGYVALAIDEFGHGATNIGMLYRGIVNHKVSKVCYGWDKEEDKTYSFISGQDRYKLLMNFSNLDFFIEKYSHSVDPSTGAVIGEEKIKDSSMGGSFAYLWLASQKYVDPTKMVVTGHSMGTWAAWSVSAAMSNATLGLKRIAPRATILQAGEIFKTMTDLADGRMAYDTDGDGFPDVAWNNPLLLSAKYDEFNYFRDYADTPINSDVEHGEANANFLGVTKEEAQFGKTFHENFDLGTSRRRNLYITNHRLLTHHDGAITDTLEWASKSTNIPLTIDASNHTFMVKEWLVFGAMLSAIVSAVAMIMLFRFFKWFEPVFAGVPNRPEKERKGWKWWKGALLTIAIGGLTYPFLTQLGHGLFPLPEVVFSMTIGNGFLIWYLFLVLVMLGFILIPYFVKKKKGKPIETDFVDMGFARNDEEHRHKFDWGLLGRSLIPVMAGFLWMYLQTGLCQTIFGLDLRFIWPFFKGFNASRFLMFLVYLPMFLIFFGLNNSKIFASNRAVGTSEKGFLGFIKVWWKYALCMVGGILLIVLLEYIPFFMQLGPGADLIFTPTFGGPFMSLLIVFAPQVIVFSVICTYCYRKTGNVFVGATLVAIMACWIVTGGSAILYTF